MRFLLYTETYPSRDPKSSRQTGIGRYCADLAAGLVELRQSVVVLTNTDIGTGEASSDGVRVLARGEVPSSLRSLVSRGRLLDRTVRSESPDHILVGDPLSHRVISLRGSRPSVPYRPLFYGSEVLAMERLLRSSGSSPGAWLARALTRRYLREAEEAVCISEYTARLVQRVAPDMRSDCIVYPSVSGLVLTHRADPAFGARLRQRLQEAGSPPPTLVLTVARISDRKNQLGVLQALARLRADTPLGFHYLIVGNVDAEGHRGYHDDLTAFIHANGLERAVSFIPNATDEEKVDYLDACDIFVMLSRTVGTSVEGFGISAIEASCRGKPVLVSDQGGMPETIIPGRTGVAVSPDATEEIARVLAEWGADPTLRLTMGSAGRAHSRAEFTPRATAARLLAHVERRAVKGTSDR